MRILKPGLNNPTKQIFKTKATLMKVKRKIQASNNNKNKIYIRKNLRASNYSKKLNNRICNHILFNIIHQVLIWLTSLTIRCLLFKIRSNISSITNNRWTTCSKCRIISRIILQEQIISRQECINRFRLTIIKIGKATKAGTLKVCLLHLICKITHKHSSKGLTFKVPVHNSQPPDTFSNILPSVPLHLKFNNSSKVWTKITTNLRKRVGAVKVSIILILKRMRRSLRPHLNKKETIMKKKNKRKKTRLNCRSHQYQVQILLLYRNRGSKSFNFNRILKYAVSVINKKLLWNVLVNADNTITVNASSRCQ